MPARLIESLATTGPLADLFADDSLLQAMLDFEAALARAEARVGVVPQTAADAIAKAARVSGFDVAALVRDTPRAGSPSIPFVKALTERVRASDPAAAKFVHWGATSQDVVDTGLVLILKKTQPLLESDLARLEAALRRLAEQHGKTVMLGRTLMQAAPPVTFGLKAAGWLGAMRRDRERLKASFAEALVLQFGGASGTLASLGEHGPAMGQVLARGLGLGYPDAPWHTQRDRLAALVCACGVLTGSLGKMARDISLMMQGEVAEAFEPSGKGRGGSSTMPHKRNPSGCLVALAAAHRVPGLVASFLCSMVQEHERGLGNWQAEWPTVAGVIQATGAAIAAMAEVADGLTVDAARMRANIEATRGTIFAEKAMMLLGDTLGRDVAHKVLEEATRQSVAQGRHLAEVLGEVHEVKNRLDPATLKRLEVPEEYLGAADVFRANLLAKKKIPGKE
jgi:3-carboxy-cis,cis-muconate cycloisomerase